MKVAVAQSQGGYWDYSNRNREVKYWDDKLTAAQNLYDKVENQLGIVHGLFEGMKSCYDTFNGLGSPINQNISSLVSILTVLSNYGKELEKLYNQLDTEIERINIELTNAKEIPADWINC